MEHLNFDKNFNNKLFGNFLTTFRSTESINEKNLQVGDTVELQMNHIPFAIASIEVMEHIDMDDYFNETPNQFRMLLSMDVGTIWERSYDTIRHYCGKNVTLLLLSVDKRF